MSLINHSYTLKTLNLVKNTATKATNVDGIISRTSSMSDKISLIGAFKDLVIYHSIDEFSTSGYITIKEQGNLIKLFPIIGWERLDIEFYIESTSHSYDHYKRSFFVYSVDSMAESSDTKIYTLRFADLAALINVSSRLEQRYTGKAEDIITKISETDMFTNHSIKNVNNSKSENTSEDGEVPALNVAIDTSTRFELDLISPCWKPFDFIRRIVSSAVSSQGTFNDCLFFQQTDGSYVFTDYLTLFNKNAIEFKKYPQVKPEITDKYTINEYVLNNLFNTQAQSMVGMFGIISKIFDFSNMSIQNFVNYYYESDSNSSETRYSAIPVDEITETDNTPGYIDKLMQPYTKGAIGDPRFSSIKQSPVGCINVSACGFDQTSVLKASSNSSSSQEETTVFQTPRYSIANGIPCKLNMRAKSAIFTMNPCTDLKLGQIVNIKMDGTESGKTDFTKIDEFLNGTWYIGNIKYSLTISNINVDVECFSSSLGLLKYNSSDNNTTITI